MSQTYTVKLEDILSEWVKGFPHYYVNKAFTPECSCHKNMHFNAHLLCECLQDGHQLREIEVTILDDFVQIYHSDPDEDGHYHLLHPSTPNFFAELEALLPKVCTIKK